MLSLKQVIHSLSALLDKNGRLALTRQECMQGSPVKLGETFRFYMAREFPTSCQHNAVKAPLPTVLSSVEFFGEAVSAEFRRYKLQHNLCIYSLRRYELSAIHLVMVDLWEKPLTSQLVRLVNQACGPDGEGLPMKPPYRPMLAFDEEGLPNIHRINKERTVEQLFLLDRAFEEATWVIYAMLVTGYQTLVKLNKMQAIEKIQNDDEEERLRMLQPPIDIVELRKTERKLIEWYKHQRENPTKPKPKPRPKQVTMFAQQYRKQFVRQHCPKSPPLLQPPKVLQEQQSKVSAPEPWEEVDEVPLVRKPKPKVSNEQSEQPKKPQPKQLQGQSSKKSKGPLPKKPQEQPPKQSKGPLPKQPPGKPSKQSKGPAAEKSQEKPPKQQPDHPQRPKPMPMGKAQKV